MSSSAMNESYLSPEGGKIYAVIRDMPLMAA